MIDHLRRLTGGIVDHEIANGELFGTVPEIYDALRDLSPEQFEESYRFELSRVRATFLAMMDVIKHKVVPGTTGSQVIDAARQLRPVLDHYLGPKVRTPHTTNQLNFNNLRGDIHMGDKITSDGNVTGSAVGSNARLKARDIVAQIQQSGLLGEDIQKVFAAAADALDALKVPEGTKEDVADDLEKLKKELEKPTKDEDRIKTIWGRINSVAPTVATALSAVASIGKIVFGSV